ncbi:MAG: hypothetical protein K2W84_09475 [Burkholderiales bacterium]|nr:hypothetical protein [Burkholderiales bacterium]
MKLRDLAKWGSALVLGFAIGAASAKLPPPSEEAKAKAAEAKAKADEAAKKDAESLAKSQDRVADRYKKQQKSKPATVASSKK